MESKQTTKPQHVVCIPFPAQGHINPMFKLAKILHAKGFHITFVNTEYNHQRLLKFRGPHSLDGLSDFRYETFPDGLPLSNIDGTQDIPSLCKSTSENGTLPIRNLIKKLNNSTVSSCVPPVTCIISDGCMSFTLDVAKEMDIPEFLFWTPSACGFMCYLHYKDLVEKGLVPLKDDNYLVNGYLETTLNWIDGISNIRLMDMPSFVRTTDINDVMLNFGMRESNRASCGTSIILNTFYTLEHSVLKAMTSILPPIYDIGPLNLLYKEMVVQGDEKSGSGCHSIGSNLNLWKEDSKCLEWLNTKSLGSIVYVNFGSITVMTNQQMVEFAWGLCNSNKEFLWIIRPDLVRGDTAILPEEFLEKTKDRSFLTSWCPQDDVLGHPAIGGFLTHCGWNSTLESICNGVPMLCWPFFAEQQTNCRYSCMEWGIGLEINNDVKREDVTILIMELMDGEKGREMRKNIQEWKMKAIAATQKGGTSFIKMEKLVNEVLTQF
ncbi:Flavonoid glucosyltransferase, family GT1 [Zostera marina]|uniref:Glycosyltransferase n=1 Tax=Zostera marina TaxID=29655 RepID=A0A0K9PS12_ZOSMR|nr:Flavonoid glucosyltransferase, family GT1 [Zostera marina]